MSPFSVNGDLWRVVRVAPGASRLVDRLSHRCLGTADPVEHVVYLSNDLVPPMLDKVLLHEIAHAVTMSYGLLGVLHEFVPEESRIAVEEWAANLVEDYSMEAIVLASESLGRPLCVNGHCAGRPLDVCFASCTM